MANIYYVYVHRRKSDNEIFYVGKGKLDRAFLGGKKRNKYWNNVATKHGFFVEIAFSNLSEPESFRLEKEAISSCKDFGCPLVNLTTGGEGLSNPSEETRLKLSKASSKRVFSSEAKAKISASKIGKPRSQETKAKLSISCSNPSKEIREKTSQASIKKWQNPEYRIKLSEAHKGKKASQETKMKMSLARKGKLHSNDTKNKIKEIKNTPENKLRLIEEKSKPILCIETGIIYKSIKDAALALGLHAQAIGKVCKKERNSTGGFTFKLIKKKV